MIIQVTQADIDKGVRCSCARCPIALALSRALKIDVQTDGHIFWFKEFLDSNIYRLPTTVARFVEKFDAKEAVEPLSFEIDLEAIKEEVEKYKNA